MPNIKSAIKRVKVSEKRRAQNASQKSSLRTTIKGFEQSVTANQVDAAQEALKVTSKKLEQAASKGLIHKNTASRKKSRLAKKLNAMTAKA